MEGSRQRSGGPPSSVLAGAYLRHKRHQFEMTLQRRFGRRTSNSSDEEAQHLSSGPDEFRDEDATSVVSKSYTFSLWTSFILIVAGSALAANILAMIGASVLYSGIVGALLAFLVGVSQLRLEDIGSKLRSGLSGVSKQNFDIHLLTSIFLIHSALRAVHNLMRKDVNRFSQENVKLEANVDELAKEVTHLKTFERALAEIATEYNSNAQHLCQLVRENRVTLDEMKQVLRDDIVADLANVVFKGERDENSEFSDMEIQRLIIYMRSLPAVTINEELLKQAIQRDRSIFALLALVRDIGLDGEQAGDSIFMIDDDSTELQTRFKEGTVLSRSL